MLKESFLQVPRPHTQSFYVVSSILKFYKCLPTKHVLSILEMRNGQVMPYACGALRTQKILGYNIDFDADNITTQSIGNRFAHVIVIMRHHQMCWKSYTHSQECITNSQIVFLRKNDEQSRNRNGFKITACLTGYS